MTRRRLGRTDIEISPIGIGTMQMSNRGVVTTAFPGVSADTQAAVVRAALDGGVNWFDTAEMYGRGQSERNLTKALRANDIEPGGVVVATKWAPLGRTAGNIRTSIDQRLAALSGFPVDLYQIHHPWGSFSSLAAQIRAMAELAKAGRIRSVGVSNFSAAQMTEASAILDSYGLRLASNQVQISALHRKIETDGVLAAAKRLGVTLIAYSPLATGILTGRFHDDPKALRSIKLARRLAGGYGKRVGQAAPLVEELRKVATAHGVSVSQVALAWLVTYYGDTVVAIPGASKPSQAEQSAGAMAVELTSAELAGIAEASRRSGALG
ncbi:aldo/keto reductase [Fodinicola acaciae]|uniref:aldo/keto reductase n=1 Tax=Fodinicola acaciae TaxID=2681555 RepID=UPI0013CFF031|nr:aldo/keto reductase [Fodinicola acaciae]